MSPSALSHALARLRGALADELFVRIGNGMQPVAAPFVIGGSELMMTVPRQAALALREAAAVAVYAAPFAIPRYTVKVYGHVRHNRTAFHLWMKRQLLELRGLMATRTDSA